MPKILHLKHLDCGGTLIKEVCNYPLLETLVYTGSKNNFIEIYNLPKLKEIYCPRSTIYVKDLPRGIKYIKDDQTVIIEI